MKKTKFIKDSTLEIKRVVGREFDTLGRERRRIQIELCEGDLELGSAVAPKNKDVIEVKYKVPSRRQAGDIIGGFFGGL